MDDHTAYRPPGGSILYHAIASKPDNTLPYQSIPGGKILHPGHQREGR